MKCATCCRPFAEGVVLVEGSDGVRVVAGTQATTQIPELGIGPLSYLLHLLSPTERTRLVPHLRIIIPAIQHRTPEYCRTALRLSPILAMHGTYATNFETVADELDWAPKTRAGYWATMLTLIALIDPAARASLSVKDATRRFDHEAATAPPWEVDDEKNILSEEKIQLLEEISPMLPPTHGLNAAYLSLVLGQRLGDVSELTPSNLFFVGDVRISVRFTRGKTVARTGIYTLSINRTQLIHLANMLMRASKMVHTDTAIWPDPHKITHQILGIDVRALRRTGLIRLSMTGADTSQLLTVSRHRSVRMLETYLGGGLFNEQAAKLQMDAFTAATRSNVPMYGGLSGAV